MFDHTIKFLLGDERDFELQYRVFNLYCLLGSIISLLFVPSAYYTDSHVGVKFLLILSIIFLCCWYLSRFRRLFSLSTFLAISILVFVVTPGLWILNSGSTGGAQYFFVFWGILICSVYNGWRRYTWLVILFVVIGVLMYIEYTYPGMINPYNSRDARYFDVYTSNIIAMLFITMIFITYANSYRNEHEHVKKYAERLEKIAISDGLTGLYNHKHLHRCLKHEIHKAERYKRFLSLIMIDTDYFKQVNDTYGHPTGNLVLLQFVNILRSNTRASDIIGRYGGDEFLIVCPETNLDRTVCIVEKLRAIVEAASFGESGQIRMTISCGITTWKGENYNQIIEQVDQALYAAKKAGRNRVEIYKDKGSLTGRTPDIHILEM